MLNNLPIGRRLILIVAAVNALVLIIVIAVSVNSGAAALQNQAMNRFIDNDLVVAGALDESLDGILNITRALGITVNQAPDDVAAPLLRGDLRDTLLTFDNTLIYRINIYRPNESAVFIYDLPNPSTANIQQTRRRSVPTDDFTSEAWVFRALNENRPIWQEQEPPFFDDEAQLGRVMSLAIPYDDAGGVLWVDIRYERFVSLVNTVLSFEGASSTTAHGYSLLVNEKREVLVEHSLDYNTGNSDYGAKLAQIVSSTSNMERGSTINFIDPFLDTTIFAYTNRVLQGRWRLVTVIPTSELPRLDFGLVILLGFISLLGVMALVVIVNRFINTVVANPIINLSWAAQEMGSGDMRYRIEYQDRLDEIGRFARALEEMKRNLAHYNERLAQSSRNLEKRVIERTKQLELAKQEAQMHANKLNAIYIESLVVVSESQLKPILQTFTDRILGLLQVSYSGVWLLNSEKTHLQLVATSGKGPNYLNAVVGIDEGMIGEVVRTREAVVVDDYANYENRMGSQRDSAPMISRALCVPLIFAGGAIGAVVVGRRDTGDVFDDNDQLMLALITNIVAPAVRNAQLLVQRDAAVEEARKADEVKTRFLASVTHELRTPLNLIINNMDFMRIGTFGDVSEEQLARLNQTIRSAEHLLYLINDLLDVSKIEAGEMELFIQPGDVYTVLDDTLDSARAYIDKLEREDAVKLVTDIDEDLPKLPMDARRIRQVLINLLSNAIKFTAEGEVTLSVKRKGDLIRFTVTDTGIGIPPEEMPKLFEAFERTTVAKQHNIEGTGLGLPISRYLVQQHKSDIGVTSQVGKGSTFSFSLPLTIPSEDDIAQMLRTDTQLMAILAARDE